MNKLKNTTFSITVRSPYKGKNKLKSLNLTNNPLTMSLPQYFISHNNNIRSYHQLPTTITNFNH